MLVSGESEMVALAAEGLPIAADFEEPVGPGTQPGELGGLQQWRAPGGAHRCRGAGEEPAGFETGELEDEFRPLFIEEAKGHLERIASGLLALEAAPDDQAAIDAIFREAHTMKGAAGMVGMMRVSRLAHRLEDLLVELRDKKRRATPELTDAMLLVVDGLGRLIASSSGSEQDSSDEAALERLLPSLPVASPPAVTDRAGAGAAR